MNACTLHEGPDRPPLRRAACRRRSAGPVAARLAVLLLAVVLVLTAGACARRDAPPAADEGAVDFRRNSEFAGPRLRVFVGLEDGGEASVDTADDAVGTRPAATPIPGHRARDWTFVKDADAGTSVAYALVSWDPDDPADYLMAGWWAQFPGQHVPELSFADSVQYAIFDGPEIDPANPPRLPLAGEAGYAGPAGGLYTYVPAGGLDADDGDFVLDEYQGTITLTADFARGTVSGCIGCEGDLVARRAHFGVFLGDEVRDARSVAAGYELHLGETPFGADGNFQHADVTVKHPERAVTQSEGRWGGTFSNLPDAAGNPRLVAGFNDASFAEQDGSVGTLGGTFVALSEPFGASGK